MRSSVWFDKNKLEIILTTMKNNLWNIAFYSGPGLTVRAMKLEILTAEFFSLLKLSK